MKPVLILLVALALAGCIQGCGTMNMSPAQIEAMAKSSSNVCFTGPGWNGGTASLSYSTFGGVSVGANGGGGTAKCGSSEVTFSSAAPAKGAP